jgi:hypothetical protein
VGPLYRSPRASVKNKRSRTVTYLTCPIFCRIRNCADLLPSEKAEPRGRKNIIRVVPICKKCLPLLGKVQSGLMLEIVYLSIRTAPKKALTALRYLGHRPDSAYNALRTILSDFGISAHPSLLPLLKYLTFCYGNLRTREEDTGLRTEALGIDLAFTITQW